MTSDLELLQRHEPIVRYTYGENFLPMDVGAFVANARLMVRRDDGEVVEVIPAGGLTLDLLAAPIADAPPGRQFLSVASEKTASELAPTLLQRRQQPAQFRRGPGRLTRVGYLSRLVDAFFSLGLLLRGRVPGALAHDAISRYRDIVGDETTHPYYGRVVREAGWIVLQYWYFYSFNDWRSSYHGANDHEADWEMVIVVLDADADEMPLWAVYAQHDYSGPELRRRWDHAAELEVIDGHPVVNAGAGSHASYFVAGEYMTEQEMALAAPLRAIATAWSRLAGTQRANEKLLPIAFIDYARGDGVAIGPGLEHTWEARLVDQEPWAPGYAGLWGAHVQDPFEGEDAPAGPMYARDGSPRGSWLDPLAFGALDSVPPPSREPSVLKAQLAAIEERRPDLESKITSLVERVASLGAEDRAVLAAGRRHATRVAGANDETDAGERSSVEQLAEARRARATEEMRRTAIEARLASIERGDVEPSDAHLGRYAVPTKAEERRFGRFLEIWAALSIGLLLLGLVVVALVLPQLMVVAAIAVIAAFLFLDSILRGTVAGVASTITLALAGLTLVILVITFWSQALVAVAIGAALFVIWQNLGELR